MQDKAKYSQFIKSKAKELGFMSCGISKAGFLEREAPRLERWLKENRNGTMRYMENYFDKRLDPTLLVDGAKSVISLLLNYYPEQMQVSDSYKISKYAYGVDYHFLIKDKLKTLLTEIQSYIGEVGGRAFVDSAPVLDRAWAEKSGLGWIGKNANLISKKVGSFFFIAELIVDLELEYDQPLNTEHCGSCMRCIDACPTEAIIAPYIVDGSKCISYYTIELKENIPKEVSGKFQDWIFGCDVCQDVCPWNRFSLPHAEPMFHPTEELLSYSKADWEEITEETFNKVFRKSAVKRTKYQGLKRNINFVLSPKG
ncbi:MAG: tRNA epoxyqueuosine(34) reductase QueG [Bacteroidota bacterium]|nr:tRNA epoxyqueuosine(34) reductase QueG [Bacteroidota bacterium]